MELRAEDGRLVLSLAGWETDSLSEESGRIIVLKGDGPIVVLLLGLAGLEVFTLSMGAMMTGVTGGAGEFGKGGERLYEGNGISSGVKLMEWFNEVSGGRGAGI